MNTPTEYFGPHAKRWTDPDTGETFSLSPRDYYRAVAKEQLQREKEVEERLRDEAVSAAWDDKALDEGVVTIDRLGDPGAAPMAGMFKEQGELVVDGGFRTPEHQRYEFEVEPSPVTISPEMAARYDAIVYGATRGGIKYPAPTADLEISAGSIKPLTAKGARFLHLSEDDTFSLIRPVEHNAPGKPAARHFRRRRSTRNMVRLGLVYIIVIIGVISVAGVIS